MNETLERHDIAQLIDDIEKGNLEIRKNALMAVIDKAHYYHEDISDAVPVLCSLLKDENYRIRIYASEALKEAARKGDNIDYMIVHLCDPLKDEEHEVKDNILQALIEAANRNKNIEIVMANVASLMEEKDSGIRKKAEKLMKFCAKKTDL